MIPGFRDTCVSAEIGVTCIVDCKDVAAACEAACSGNNDCIIGCNQELTSCLVSCPCMDDCPDGCNDCGHPLCSCQDPDSNPDYVACLEEMDIAFTNCVLACNHNQECYADCNRDYVDNVEKCPCNSKCENGCPCEEYYCEGSDTKPGTTTPATTTTTIAKTTVSTANKSILVLSTYKPENVPIVIQPDGAVLDDIDFSYGTFSEAYHSCSLTYQNRMLIFGGHDHKRQISEIIECGIYRVGDLKFDFTYGACTVANNKISLCFDSSKPRDCYESEGDLDRFKPISKSNFAHMRTRIAASAESIFVVGDSYELKLNQSFLVEKFTFFVTSTKVLNIIIEQKCTIILLKNGVALMTIPFLKISA